MKVIPGPDFPTGGIIIGQNDIIPGYEKGRGSIKIRGEIEVEEGSKDKKLLSLSQFLTRLTKLS